MDLKYTGMTEHTFGHISKCKWQVTRRKGENICSIIIYQQNDVIMHTLEDRQS